MPSQWKEVAQLAFKGKRFEGHALDLDALAELGQFQKMVAETAKALWRAAHPDRQRLPKGFEECTRLCLRRIEEGSAVAPLEVWCEEPQQQEFLPSEPPEVDAAIAMTHDVYRAVADERPLPDSFPQSLIPEFERWGQRLTENEAIEFGAPARRPVCVTSSSRSRLASFADVSHEGPVDMAGEVLEADIRHGRFQMWPDDTTGVTVAFTPDQEDEVTNALRDHRSLRLRVVGRGRFSATGALERVTVVEQMHLQPAGEISYDPMAPSIESVLVELAREVPASEWDRLPSDLTDNLDHYLYGTSKR